MNQIKDPLEESPGQVLGGARRNIHSPLPLPLALSLTAALRVEARSRRTRQTLEVGLTKPRLFVFPCKNANQSQTSTQQTNKQNKLAICTQGWPRKAA